MQQTEKTSRSDICGVFVCLKQWLIGRFGHTSKVLWIYGIPFRQDICETSWMDLQVTLVTWHNSLVLMRHISFRAPPPWAGLAVLLPEWLAGLKQETASASDRNWWPFGQEYANQPRKIPKSTANRAEKPRYRYQQGYFFSLAPAKRVKKPLNIYLLLSYKTNKWISKCLFLYFYIFIFYDNIYSITTQKGLTHE